MILKDLKRRIWIRTISFLIHNTVRTATKGLMDPEQLKADLEVGVEDVLLRLPFLQLLQRCLAVHPAHHTYGTVPHQLPVLITQGSGIFLGKQWVPPIILCQLAQFFFFF